MKNGTLNFSPPITVPGTQYNLPYVFLGDEAFPLLENLHKPYSQKNGLTKEQRIYNYRHCRARRVVENAFGILATRFRVFRSEIGISVDKVDSVVLAACVLQNYLLNKTNTYIGPGDIDRYDMQTGELIPGEWRNVDNGIIPLQRTPRGMTQMAKKNRYDYKLFLATKEVLVFKITLI